MQNTKLVLGVLILLLFIAAAMELNTMWHEQEALTIAALVKKQEQIDSLQARLYWNSMKRSMDFTPPLAKLEVSSPVGYRLNPMGGDIEALHKGIDLVGKIGTPVVAVLDGVVMESTAKGFIASTGIFHKLKFMKERLLKRAKRSESWETQEFRQVRTYIGNLS